MKFFVTCRHLAEGSLEIVAKSSTGVRTHLEPTRFTFPADVRIDLAWTTWPDSGTEALKVLPAAEILRCIERRQQEPEKPNKKQKGGEGVSRSLPNRRASTMQVHIH